MSANSDLLTVYLAKRDDLKRYLLGLCRDEEVTDEILQDMYIRLSEKGAPPDLDRPLAYLFRMSNHLWLNRMRATANQKRRDSDWHALNPQQDGEWDASPNPEAALAARQALAAALDVLEEMPPRQREVFRLHKINGASHPEIARALGLSVSAVEKHVSAAMKRLRAAMQTRKLH